MCRPQNVHIAGITLTPTAVAADDTILSKWWYLLVVGLVHGARLNSLTRALLHPDTLYSHAPLVSRQCG